MALGNKEMEWHSLIAPDNAMMSKGTSINSRYLSCQLTYMELPLTETYMGYALNKELPKSVRTISKICCFRDFDHDFFS